MTDRDEQLESLLRARKLPGLSDEARRRLLDDLASDQVVSSEQQSHREALTSRSQTNRKLPLVAVASLAASLLITLVVWQLWPGKTTEPIVADDPQSLESLPPAG